MAAAIGNPASHVSGLKDAIEAMPVSNVAFAGFAVPSTAWLAHVATFLPLALVVLVNLASLALIVYKARLEKVKHDALGLPAPPPRHRRSLWAGAAMTAVAVAAFLTFRSSRASAPDSDMTPVDSAGAIPGMPVDVADYFAVTESHLGMAERLPNGRANPDVQAMCPESGLPATEDVRRTPWCAIYVNWVLSLFGRKGTGSPWALSFRQWKGGTEVELEDARPGDVVVLRRLTGGKWDGVSGHVGFFVSRTGKRVTVRGGNQGDKVCDATFHAVHVLCVKRPLPSSQPTVPPKDRTGASLATAGAGAVGAAATGTAVATGALEASKQLIDAAETIKQAQGPLQDLGTPFAVKIAAAAGVACAALTLAGLWFAYRHKRAAARSGADNESA